VSRCFRSQADVGFNSFVPLAHPGDAALALAGHRGSPGQVLQLNVQGHGGCALSTDGSASCWGDNYYFPSGVYSSLGGPYAIRPDGTVVALRPDNSFTLPTGTFVELSGGSTGGCARRSDDTLACWGNNFTERLEPPRHRALEASCSASPRWPRRWRAVAAAVSAAYFMCR
jgi:hypothetical protein